MLTLNLAPPQYHFKVISGSSAKITFYAEIKSYRPLAREVTSCAISAILGVKDRHPIGAISTLCVRNAGILMVAPMGDALTLTPKVALFARVQLCSKGSVPLDT